MIGRFVTLPALVLLLVSSAVAQREGNPENWCRGGAFPMDSGEFSIGLVKQTAGQKVYFYNDLKDDCPFNERCRDKSYVVPGDKVVISRTFKGFACSWYLPGKGFPTTGWIKSSELVITHAGSKPTVSRWLCKSKYADNSISITENKLPGMLNITGEAFWQGLGDNVHIGELDDRAAPKGNILKVGENDRDEFACKVTLLLIDAFLVVRDNMNCGGANVTFSGVYKKEK